MVTRQHHSHCWLLKVTATYLDGRRLVLFMLLPLWSSCARSMNLGFRKVQAPSNCVQGFIVSQSRSSARLAQFPTTSQLDHLEEQGVLTRVDHGEWATPLVVVPRKNGKVRLCGNYKVSLNPVIDVDQYPLAKPLNLFATLSGGRQFCFVAS